MSFLCTIITCNKMILFYLKALKFIIVFKYFAVSIIQVQALIIRRQIKIICRAQLMQYNNLNFDKKLRSPNPHLILVNRLTSQAWLNGTSESGYDQKYTILRPPPPLPPSQPGRCIDAVASSAVSSSSISTCDLLYSNGA